MTTDLLAGLGERGWDAAPGGGWTNKTLDITVRQASPTRYTLAHAGATRELTSATGVLCVIDAIENRQAAAS